MFDRVALLVFPSLDIERPISAMAVLTSLARAKGRDIKVWDLNLRLYEDLDKDAWLDADKFWRLLVPMQPDTELLVRACFERYAREVADYDPDFLGVNIFSLMSHQAADMWLRIWREQTDDRAVIVAGGAGLTSPTAVSVKAKVTADSSFSTREYRIADCLMDEELIDHYLIGDGEDAFMSMLDGNFDHPGIDGRAPEQLKDLDRYPLSDYSLADPGRYKYTQFPGVYITSSRGCVRSCKFCDIAMHWPKFRYRRGVSVADEIYTHWQRHGVRIFQFNDSVTNGNLTEYLNMNSRLAELREQNPDMDIRLLGQFNVQSRKRMTEQQYEMASRAGWKTLIPGIESYSERVRYDMGKDFSNEDIDWHFYQCGRWGMQNIVLMFVGYPTETLEDHEKNIEFLHRYQKYMYAGVIAQIRWGWTGSIDVGTKLSERDLGFRIVPQIADLDLSHMHDHDTHWIYGRNWINLDNPDMTLEERMRRRMELHNLSLELQYPITRPREELEIIRMIMQEFKGVGRHHSVNRQVIPIFAAGDH